MPIQSLSAATARLLGAAQVAVSPLSTVKELLDNAYDAKASSITIEIAANTVDFIRVTDNGIGIPPEDQPRIGQLYNTSKLREISELCQDRHGLLGFRGVALASITELADIVTITTKTEGEVYGRQFDIGKECKAVSQATGTTIRAVALFTKLPVRKQNAVKNAKLTITHIRDLLKAYAFCRPQVRLSLRVGGKSSWIYPAKSDLMSSAFAIVGSKVAKSCQPTEFLFTREGEICEEDDAYTITALVVDLENTDSCSQFISVNNRPMNTTRGVFRKIVKIYKEGLSAKSRSPFLYLQIQCPPSSLDQNVEPAKDSVMFSDEAMMLRMVSTVFGTNIPPLLPQSRMLEADITYASSATSPEPTNKPCADDKLMANVPCAIRTPPNAVLPNPFRQTERRLLKASSDRDKESATGKFDTLKQSPGGSASMLIGTSLAHQDAPTIQGKEVEKILPPSSLYDQAAVDVDAGFDSDNESRFSDLLDAEDGSRPWINASIHAPTGLAHIVSTPQKQTPVSPDTSLLVSNPLVKHIHKTNLDMEHSLAEKMVVPPTPESVPRKKQITRQNWQVSRKVYAQVSDVTSSPTSFSLRSSPKRKSARISAGFLNDKTYRQYQAALQHELQPADAPQQVQTEAIQKDILTGRQVLMDRFVIPLKPPSAKELPTRVLVQTVKIGVDAVRIAFQTRVQVDKSDARDLSLEAYCRWGELVESLC